MNERDFGPAEPRQAGSVAGARTGPLENRERHSAGTRAALVKDIEKPLDRKDHSRKRLRWEACPTRGLRAHYALSGALAAVVAAELAMGSAL